MEAQSVFEEQIIIILKEHEAGIPVAALCRKHRVSDASIYNWKARFGEMEVSEAKRAQGTGGRERQAQADAGRCHARQRRTEGSLGNWCSRPGSPSANGRSDYNGSRPHSGLSWQTPSAFASTFNPRRDLALPSPMAPRQIQPLTPPPDLTQPPERTHDWIKLRGEVTRGC